MALKRVLFVGEYPNPVDKYRNVFFQNLVFAIAEKGVECVVISPVSITHYRKKASRIPLFEVNRSKSGKQIPVYHPRFVSYSSKKFFCFNSGRWSEHSLQKAALKQAGQIEGNFDCVYGHFFLGGGLAAARIGQALGIPSFVAYGECSYETEVEFSYGEIKADELKSLKGIITVSTDNSNELRKRKVFNNYPILLAPNGIDPELFHKVDRTVCRQKLGIRDDLFVIGFVGGFIERKGTRRLLEAVRQIDGVYAAFAGKGEEKPEGERIVFCDAMEHDNIPILLNMVDVFVLPTLAEGCCNAVVEAMACGLPVISSDLPFNHDILNETNSILIDPMNIDEIRDAIIRIKDDAEFRNSLSQGALETAKQLTIEVRSNNILRFMEEGIRRM